MKTSWGIALACLIPAVHAYGQLSGYESLADWNAIATSTSGIQAGLASSYDRSGTNLSTYGDYNNYAGVDPNTGLFIIASINGPGELTRFWMPHFSANGPAAIKVFLDVNLSDPNATQTAVPVINTNTSAFLPAQTYGSGPQFRSPLVQTLLGGTVSYEPITFQQSALVEIGGNQSTAGAPNFYQVGYRSFQAGTTIPTYTGTLTAKQQTDRAAAVQVLNNVGSNPGPTPSQSQSTSGVSVGGNQGVTLASLTGSGQIGALKLQMPSGTPPTDSQLDGLRLRISYDGNSTPAVDVPISRFFGVGHGNAPYSSLPMGADANGNYYCYFPMPYRNGATVQLYNSTGSAIPFTSALVQYTPGTVAANANYFHAVYQSQVTTSGQAAFNMLHVAGSGHYVGNILSIQSPSANSLEGNDIVTVDGSSVLEGTGVEDAYNGGYYYNHAGGATATSDNGDVVNPSSGALPYSGLLAFGGGGNTSQYRWLIGDSVPFSQSLDVSMQNAGGAAGVAWDSAAFYYSDSSVPEPSSLCLLGIAWAALLAGGRRHRRPHNG